MAVANVEAELDAARAWAGRHNWCLQWLPGELSIRAATYHRAVHRLVEVTVRCEGYRAVPPQWRFVRPGSDEPGNQWFPAPIGSSIFHPSGVLCAPWNRLAYS